MTSFKLLLVGADFSVEGHNAVRRAALLAREHSARLHVLHVVKTASCNPLRDWLSPRADIDLRAAQARAALQSLAVEITGACDVTPTVEVLVGDPFETLLRASERADLLVLGRRGRSRFKGLLFGSTADRLLRSCRGPALVVRAPAEQSYRRVLVPIDFTASSDAALRVAAQMRREAGMQVFHAINSRRDAVLRDADVPEHIIREARLMEEAGTNARMRRKVADLGLDGSPMSFALTYGPAVSATLRQARQLGADLIVAGKQRRSTASGFLLGSVSGRVLSEAACDTLIVPRLRDSSPSHAAATGALRLKLEVSAHNELARRALAARDRQA